MRVGIVIGRIGGIDGVSLETEKWITVLSRMGHETRVLTGEVEGPVTGATIAEELAFSHPDCVRAQEDAFYRQEADEAGLLRRLERDAFWLERRILSWMETERIDVLLTENATTLPCHLSMGMALKRVIERTNIPAIAHDHDFHWERGARYRTRYSGIREIIAECFPPVLPNLRHVVINSYCQQSLARQLGMASTVVPNVMDFEAPFGRVGPVNRGLPAALGLREDDIPLFQITRIVRRKGIETAIELVHRLDDPRVKLVLTGTSKDDRNEAYTDELRTLVGKLGLREQVLFAGDRFANTRGIGADGREVYSLSDAYAHARACTYFSRYEGFGNAFVEALVARRPIFVNDYRPVYWPDIGSKGFRTVQIDYNVLTEDAVYRIESILHDERAREEIGDFNFELGRKHFSYEVLEVLLGGLLPGGTVVPTAEHRPQELTAHG
jgi:glycosyltransferase involved in cell wall biosynthesis